MPISQLKKFLLDQCQQFVEKRISNARQELHAVREAVENEKSSSAGDKYNTDRAMIQIEIEKYERQLTEARKLEKAMNLISIERCYDNVDLGSLVDTNIGSYFFSIGMGKINTEEGWIYAISPASPLGQHLLGKKAGDQVNFNNKTIIIHTIS